MEKMIFEEAYSNPDYFSVKAVNNSFIKEYEASPLRAFKMFNGEIVPKEKEEYAIGSAFHCYFLENKEFAKRYEVVDEMEKPKSPQQHIFCEKIIETGVDANIGEIYSSIYKAKGSQDKINDSAKTLLNQLSTYIRVQTTLKNENKLAITKSDFEMIKKMWVSVSQNKGVVNLLKQAESHVMLVEEPIYFGYKPHDTDDEDEMPCKAKPDLVIINDRMMEICVVDVKTTSNNVLGGFINDFYGYKYYRQFSFYDHAIRVGMSLKRKDGNNYDEYQYSHKTIVTNKEENVYDSAVYNIDNHTIERGREEMFELLYRIYYSFRSNQWEHTQGYYHGNGEYNMPIK